MKLFENKTEKIKRIFDKFRELFKGTRLWFFVFAVLALLIPDLVLKSKVIFVDFRVDEGWWLRAFLCNIVPVLFTLLWIGLILFVCVYMLPKRSGRIVFIIIASLANILMVSEFIYYTMFGRFFMLSSMPPFFISISPPG